MKPDAGASRAYLEKYVLTQVKTRLHYTFRLRATNPASVSAQAMSMGVGNGSTTTTSMGVTIAPSSALLYEQSFGGAGMYKSYPLAFVPAAGVFHDVDVLLTLDTSPAHILIKIDGQIAADRDSQVGFAPAQTAFFQAGGTFASPSPEIEVDVDDVLIEAD